MNHLLERRPVMVGIAGPNGAGKSTFYDAHIRPAGLRLVNADVLAMGLDVDAYDAARLADALRRQLVRARESFAFETVFSDPVGDKLRFMGDTVAAGYTVVLCFIGISDWALSEERVAMRVSQGGHDVPTEKLKARFPRVMNNLATALHQLPHVWVFDNDDMARPFRRVAVVEQGCVESVSQPVPGWLVGLLP